MRNEKFVINLSAVFNCRTTINHQVSYFDQQQQVFSEALKHVGITLCRVIACYANCISLFSQ